MADTQPVSVKTFNISGIPTHVYGLAELKPAAASTHEPTPVDCLWLLHRRKGDYTQMTPFATRVLRAWNAGPMSAERGLLAIAFDHRNHGARLVDGVANLGWKHNATHAVDLYAVFHGTATDVSLLIDYIEQYLFPDDPAGRVAAHMVLGASLGGHSAWHCALWDRRITDIVSVIGCPDYISLMRGRAQDANRIGPGEDLIGTPDFPHTLSRAVQRTDPMCRLEADQRSTAGSAVKAALDGKRILCLSGGQDTLVPHAMGQRFRDQLRPGGILHAVRAQVRDVVDDEAGHKFTEKMERYARDFIVDCLAQRVKGECRLGGGADFGGFSTVHI